MHGRPGRTLEITMSHFTARVFEALPALLLAAALLLPSLAALA